jgi:lysophospholipase L1-like esterase
MQNRRQFIKTSCIAALIPASVTTVQGKERKKNAFFINSGAGGNNTADLLSRIDADCLGYRPSLTLLMAGTNDMNSMKYIPLPQYEENMRSIISKILSINSKVLLMTIPPVYEPYLFTRHNKSFYEPDGHKKRLESVNRLIKQLADEYGLCFLDVYHIFSAVGNTGEDENSLIKNVANSNRTDGVHPTEYGNMVIAVSIYQCIVQLQLPYERVVCFGDSITAGGYPQYLKKLL